MKVYISSDHGGFGLKKILINKLRSFDFDVEDLGPDKYLDQDDYTDYAEKLSKKVLGDNNSRGILICKSGVGMCVAANKIKGIYCALTFDVLQSHKAVVDDNVNVIAIPSDYINHDVALEICRSFLNSDFMNSGKYLRRFEKVKKLEELD